ncbi:NAD(P)-dependent dehydrogenase (short-subunit alcohol dehydrogenase family) [Solibacillus kalamii]|uniref:3-ketoacyl-ACP reductase n=1 Tax=Solibacillus kalamii TaxID=1748298 RepID=A0ABX3ZC49_9BACL|nr:SDR family oxidoreductase [Solibacillus kalamii]MBM7667223.1 NAD(P)-dependent dehydrogenase (short-subunit alcohol dehydrogenase family) [Solibacillus kalamii]OUZ37318.1 3-ketoacyl-ACP reductase [Solibacillus kalamii]
MFQNKTVVITGAAQGIGRSIATHFAKAGANVVIADIEHDLGVQLAGELQKEGYSAIFAETDVRSEENVRQTMEMAASRFGGLHILINNAGKAKWISPLELSLEDWDDIIQTNLRSVFLCSREAAKLMKSGGAIINLASTRAVMSEPNSEGYAASKGGILALTHALASSFSKLNITVNSISPGWIETGDYDALRPSDHAQHFSNRVGKPDDIARACLYLANPENDFITGTDLTIDGGMTKKMIYEE